MADLPTGTVTFLYTDLEGSTARWERHPAAMRAAVARHDAVLRDAIAAHHGHVFRSTGDGLCAAFAVAPDAVAAALATQRALQAEPWGESGPLRARMALHTGAAEVQGGDYVGACLNRVGRLLAVAHGGQIILSDAVQPLVRDALPAASGLHDLGEHRLRDLTHPERVHQVLHADLPADFPALRSLDAYPHNLPLQLTSFVGREAEMAEVARLLTTTRLLTLTGAGGVGKTRLALQVAAEVVDEYPDGVWLVELAPLADPALVAQAVATTLGVRDQPGQPILATVLLALRAKRLLVLLDNCEHLLDASARLADALLHGCAGLRVLATSREALAIAGEVSWRVPSLGLADSLHLPPLADLAAVDAIRLFLDRATAAEPRFALTPANAAMAAQVCRRLDGIPLAIELAAARVRALPVEEIARRLDDRFRLLTGGSRTALPRQQTLRAAIDWSYQLLTEPERAALQRLSAFAGGGSLAAAEAVCAGDGIEAWAVVDLLARLVDKSLLLAEAGPGGEARYRLLETVRQYARDRLVERGATETIQDRHCDYFAALAGQLEPLLFTGDQIGALARLDVDQDNLRAALTWSLDGDPERGLRLAGSLWHYWRVRGRDGEGLRWLAALLARTPATAPGRATALLGAGTLTFQQGDHAAARPLLDESRALFRAAGDRRGEAWALRELGGLLRLLGDLAHAQPLIEEGLALARAAGDRRGIGFCLYHLAINLTQRGDHGRARLLAEEGVAELRALGDAWSLAGALRGLGIVLTDLGDVAPARAAFEEAVALFQTLEDRAGLGWTFLLFGQLVYRAGDDAEAQWRLEEGLAICQEIGRRTYLARALGTLGRVAWRRGEGERAVQLLREGLAVSREVRAPLESVECLEGLALVLAEQAPRPAGAQRAARWLGAAEATRQALGAPRPPVERAEQAATVLAARLALGEAAFEAARAAGRALTLEATIAEALAEEGGDG